MTTGGFTDHELTQLSDGSGAVAWIDTAKLDLSQFPAAPTTVKLSLNFRPNGNVYEVTGEAIVHTTRPEDVTTRAAATPRRSSSF